MIDVRTPEAQALFGKQYLGIYLFGKLAVFQLIVGKLRVNQFSGGNFFFSEHQPFSNSEISWIID